jgi:hypothetical protein
MSKLIELVSGKIGSMRAFNKIERDDLIAAVDGVSTIQTAITANTGSTQGTGEALTEGFNEITVCANAGDAVTLPTAVAGWTVRVKNNGATSADIFPFLADSIDTESANVAIAIEPGQTISFTAVTAVIWETTGRVPPVAILDAVQQDLTGAGAASVTSYYTAWTTGSTDALTLASGTFVGQLKKIAMIVDGGTGTLTPASFVGSTSVAYADVGDYCVFRWNGVGWRLIELGNNTTGAAGPAVT